MRTTLRIRTLRTTTLIGVGLTVATLVVLAACASSSSPGPGANSGSTPASTQSGSPATGSGSSGSSGSVPAGSPAATGAAELPGGAAALQVTGWKLDGLISQKGSTVSAVAATVTAWVRFNANEIAFDNSCNRGGGQVEITRSTMIFGSLRSTLIGCDGAAAQTEAAMNAVLQGTATYTVASEPSGGVLTIMAEDGATGLQFVADPKVGADAFPSGVPSSGVESRMEQSSVAVTSVVASPPSSGG